MNKRARILEAIEELPDVESIRVTGELPLPDGRYMIQLFVYFDNKGLPMPKSLGVQVSDGINTKEKLG